MSRYTGPIVRKSRRYGAILFGNGKSKENAYKKRKYAPGQHGRGGFKSVSEYGKQLNEKQKARFMYGVSEKHIRKYYKEADRKEGVTGKELMKLLERRLDNVVYRAGFANSRRQSRQMVTHGHMELNGRRVDVPSIQVNAGDVITVRSKCQNSPLYAEVKASKKPEHARWLDVDYGKLTIKVESIPEDDDLDPIIDSQLIVEFYSK